MGPTKQHHPFREWHVAILLENGIDTTSQRTKLWHVAQTKKKKKNLVKTIEMRIKSQ